MTPFTHLTLGLALLGTASFASAEFPDKPITLVVPFAAGGPSDKIARDLAEALRKPLGGQTVVIENSVGAGGTIVVLSPSGWRSPVAVRNVWRLVERFRPEVFGGVPTVLGAALNVPVDGADVSSIRICSGGGSAIPVPIGRAYAQRFEVPVVEVYGMTETSSVHTLAYLDRPIRHQDQKALP